MNKHPNFSFRLNVFIFRELGKLCCRISKAGFLKMCNTMDCLMLRFRWKAFDADCIQIIAKAMHCTFIQFLRFCVNSPFKITNRMEHRIQRNENIATFCILDLIVHIVGPYTQTNHEMLIIHIFPLNRSVYSAFNQCSFARSSKEKQKHLISLFHYRVTNSMIIWN